MTNRRLPFRLDRHEKKLLGVCAGIGRSLRIDPTIVRIAVVAVPIMTFVTFWQMMIAYLICAMIGVAGSARRRRREFEMMDAPQRTTIDQARHSLDATDRRLMAIDHHLHSSESDALAREIEALRKEKA